MIHMFHKYKFSIFFEQLNLSHKIHMFHKNKFYIFSTTNL
jgi:hypothetical protein